MNTPTEREDVPHHSGANPPPESRIPVWNRLAYPTRRKLDRALLYAFVVLALVPLVFPLYWMFKTAFSTNAEMFTKAANLFPSVVTLAHYEELFELTDFVLFYQNSIIVALGVVVLTTTLSTLGGYGLARIDIPGKRIFARGILFGYMFPAILLSIPMFIFWRQLGLINNYLGLILAETALSLPFSLWLMWKFFQTVPVSLEESAQVGGATRFQAFTDIALPMAKPGIIAVAIFSYAVSWNAFTMPKILLTDSSRWVLTVGVFSFVDAFSVEWGLIMAASSLIILPAFLFVYFLQKYLLRGFRAGGVG